MKNPSHLTTTNTLSRRLPAHLSFGALAASCFLMSNQLETRAQSDNFNDGNDTLPLPAWIRNNPILTGSWSFPGGNTYRIQTAASPDPGNFGPGRAASILPVNYTNFYATVDIVGWDDTIHQVAGVMARITTPGAGTTKGYMFTHDRGNPSSATSGDMDIIRLDGEVPTGLTTKGTDSIHLEVGKSYRLVFIGIGTNFTGQVYELPDTLFPVVNITASDSTYSNGNPGLVVANNAPEIGYTTGGDATFDNFFVTNALPNLFDNFNDGNDTAPAPAWVRYNPIGVGSWSFPGGNTYRIQSAPSPDPGTFGQGRAGSVQPGNYTNFYVAADIVAWDDTIHQIGGVLARARDVGPGTTSGYLFSHDRGNPASSTSGDMDIVRLDGEVPTSLPTTGTDSIHLVPGKQYRFAFIGVDDLLIGRVYELPNASTPILEITATDSSYPNGSSGLVVANNSSETGFNGGADVTFDNFLQTTAEPRLTVELNGGVVTLSWPLIPFTLQTAATMTSPVWTDVVGGITQTADKNTYSVTGSDAIGFYRLIYP
jgi:hypothetical protein